MSEYIDFPSTNFGLYVDATNILQGADTTLH